MSKITFSLPPKCFHFLDDTFLFYQSCEEAAGGVHRVSISKKDYNRKSPKTWSDDKIRRFIHLEDEQRRLCQIVGITFVHHRNKVILTIRTENKGERLNSHEYKYIDDLNNSDELINIFKYFTEE